MDIITKIKWSYQRVYPTIQASHSHSALLVLTTMTALTQAHHFPALRATQPARQIAHTVKGLQGLWSTWSKARRQAREDRQMWNAAQTDSRVMIELTCAMSRQGN